MMGNVKLFMAISLIMSIATITSAAEVISIDINNYGNDVAYEGGAAVAGATEWVVYYGGWGEPLGSPRSANLAATGTVQASTYAEQVWVADAGDHDYITGAGDGLLDDGFLKSTSYDPNFIFIGSDLFGEVEGQNHAYSGTYDMYVYGNSEGDFTLTDANGITIASDSVAGTTSGFVEGENYVVFPDVSIAEPGSVLLWYSSELNGIQLVNTDNPPFPVIAAPSDPNESVIDARDYDVARDTNNREDEVNDGFTFYGPDLGTSVHYLDTGELMEYDLFVDAANAGQYGISAEVVTRWGIADLALYIDDIFQDTLAYDFTETEIIYETNVATVNLFEGNHTLKWVTETGEVYFDVLTINFSYIGEITLDDCADVYKYGLELAGDASGDCRVNLDDLAAIAAEWTEDYNLLAQ